MGNLPAAIDYRSQKMRDTIRATVAVDATDAELEMFIAFCESTGLNPFKKEIWFIKTKARSWTGADGRPVVVEPRVTMMTGINGFFQIANRHPAYDGMSEPEFEESSDGLPRKCTVRVYRKDRSHPSVGVARWSEYFPGATKKGESQWEKKPFHMLAKVAKSIALREAFPQELNGLFTEDEVTEAEPLEAVTVEAPKREKRVRKPVQDDPEWLGAPAPDPLLELRNAIDGEDWARVGAHVIETKCSLQGQTVREAVERYRETAVANLKRFKHEADRLAVAAYIEAHPVRAELEPITFTQKDIEEMTNG